MKKTSKIILIILILSQSFVGTTQDTQYSQYYSNPLYLNPAFAGNNVCPVLRMNYRNQWPGVDGNYKTYGFSYDKYVSEISGGVGVLLTHDQSGIGNLSTTSLNILYAYTATLTKTVSFKAGFQFGAFQNAVNWEKLQFADMFDGTSTLSQTSNESQPNTTAYGIDMSAGGILYSDVVFGGVAVHHLTEPEQDLFGYEDSKLKRRYSFHAGANLKPIAQIKDIVISPNALVDIQGNFKQINVGCYADYKSFVVGAWYRHKEAILFLVGVDYNNFKIGYSFDYTISNMGFVNSLGAHEISCAYKFKCKPGKRRKYRTASCPQF